MKTALTALLAVLDYYTDSARVLGFFECTRHIFRSNFITLFKSCRCRIHELSCICPYLEILIFFRKIAATITIFFSLMVLVTKCARKNSSFADALICSFINKCM